MSSEPGSPSSRSSLTSIVSSEGPECNSDEVESLKRLNKDLINKVAEVPLPSERFQTAVHMVLQFVYLYHNIV
jgi:hypothetical protein